MQSCYGRHNVSHKYVNHWWFIDFYSVWGWNMANMHILWKQLQEPSVHHFKTMRVCYRHFEDCLLKANSQNSG